MTEKKNINCLLPKGFKMLVEESFQSGLDKIFVFVNKENKRLYMKLCSLEDIRKGIIWEILNPSELKTLNIEESYNQEVYKNEGFVVEESASEDEQEKIRKEAKEFMEEQKRKNLEKSGVTINLVSGSKEPKEKGIEGKFGENMLLKLQHDCSNLGIEYTKPQTIADVHALISAVQTVRKAQAERSAEPVGHGSSGQLTLAQQSGSGSKEFSSIESMYDSLREQSRSKNEQEQKSAQLILDELFRKSLKGMKEIKNYRTSYEGKESERDRLNREFRKERKKEKDDEDE